MKRLFLIAVVLLALCGIGVVAWQLAGLPSAGMVWGYGFDYSPGPTGRTLTIEGVEFVEIGPGCYLMGSEHLARGGDLLGQWCARFGLPWGDQPKPSNEMPVHWVEFPSGFWIARTEITNAQFAAFAPDHERTEDSPRDSDPVLDVFWEDAKKYCGWLSKQSGQAIRLPSEPEWECACRAGSNREFCFGDDEKHLSSYAWYLENSDLKAHEVGSRRANAWGLHDLHGNALEWCEDTYHENYEGAPADGTAWTEEGALYRVNRGGSSFSGWDFCPSPRRDWDVPGGWSWNRGFRLAYWHLDH